MGPIVIQSLVQTLAKVLCECVDTHNINMGSKKVAYCWQKKQVFWITDKEKEGMEELIKII